MMMKLGFDGVTPEWLERAQGITGKRKKYLPITLVSEDVHGEVTEQEHENGVYRLEAMEEWPRWRLVFDGRLNPGWVFSLTDEEVDRANAALDLWIEARNRQFSQKK